MLRLFKIFLKRLFKVMQLSKAKTRNLENVLIALKRRCGDISLQYFRFISSMHSFDSAEKHLPLMELLEIFSFSI